MSKPPIIEPEDNDEPARYHPPGGSQAGGPVVSGIEVLLSEEELGALLKCMNDYWGVDTDPDDPKHPAFSAFAKLFDARAALAKARGEA